jgi:competence protein ComEC
MPAVAPAMWLGMVTTAAAQIPGLPLQVPNGLDALLLGYIAQVAAWCGRPSWAEVHVRLGAAGLAGSYLALAASIPIGLRLARRRRLAAARRRKRPAPAPRRLVHVRRVTLVAALAAFLGLSAVAVAPRGAATPSGPAPELRIEVLDVGQGDAILLAPAAAPAVLVDGGPPGDGLAGKLEAAGVHRLGAAVVTHDQSDHAGGIEELLGGFPVARLLYGRLGRGLLGEARAAGAEPVQLAQGADLRSGRLDLEVLWPPAELLSEAPADTDPNQLALVILARWRRFSMLLTADAEAESVPIEPGPIDVLKVAHHGSDDAGLASLLDRSRPRLAVISVGSGNPYGHPTAGTLATLAGHGVPTLRTDLHGTIEIDVSGRSSFAVTG